MKERTPEREKEIERATEYYKSKGMDNVKARHYAEQSVLFDKNDWKEMGEAYIRMLS